MTYLAFLLIFVVPPLLLLALIQPRPLAGVGGRRALLTLPLLSLIALLYTTPWDNYLVSEGVWSYGEDRVLGTIGFVPVEEYAFFLLQPLLTGLFTYLVLARRWASLSWAAEGHRRWLVFFLAITALGLVLLFYGGERSRYMGLILAWGGPVLCGMWAYAGAYFWRLRGPCLLSVAVPTLYLWIADAVAIRLGIWDISNRYSFGVDPLGLPAEEAAFFLITNLIVVQGTVLFLFGDQIAAMRSALKHDSM